MRITSLGEWWRTASFACPQCGNTADDGFHSASIGGEEAVSCEECDHVFTPQRPTLKPENKWTGALKELGRVILSVLIAAAIVALVDATIVILIRKL